MFSKWKGNEKSFMKFVVFFWLMYINCFHSLKTKKKQYFWLLGFPWLGFMVTFKKYGKLPSLMTVCLILFRVLFQSSTLISFLLPTFCKYASRSVSLHLSPYSLCFLTQGSPSYFNIFHRYSINNINNKP